MDAEVVLRTVDLSKEYGTGRAAHRALDRVSLDVPAGRFVSVMGPSGSGKSTLLHMLGALDSPTAGEVWFEGSRLGGLSDRERTLVRRRRVGFVFQQFNLVPVLSAEDNIALPLVVDRVAAAERKARLGELLELVGLERQRRQLPAELSGGEQQRVAIARALVMRPAVLLADEPTGNLDTDTGQEILKLIRSAQKELGQTVVMVTHDARAAAVGDEVLRLRDGRIAGSHTLARRRRTAVRDITALLESEPCEV